MFVWATQPALDACIDAWRDNRDCRLTSYVHVCSLGNVIDHQRDRERATTGSAKRVSAARDCFPRVQVDSPHDASSITAFLLDVVFFRLVRFVLSDQCYALICANFLHGMLSIYTHIPRDYARWSWGAHFRHPIANAIKQSSRVIFDRTTSNDEEDDLSAIDHHRNVICEQVVSCRTSIVPFNFCKSFFFSYR